MREDEGMRDDKPETLEEAMEGLRAALREAMHDPATHIFLLVTWLIFVGYGVVHWFTEGW